MDKQALIHKYIEQNPYHIGVANARIVDEGVPVWAIIGYLKGFNCDAAEAARAYRLPLPAVEAAIAYYEQHRCAIDTRTAANALPAT